MSRDKQIEEMAKDLLNVSNKASNIIMEETHEFISQKHKYKSLKDFHEAHPKGRNLIEAELLTELGYAKASDVAREIFEEIEKKVKTSLTIPLEKINKKHIKDSLSDDWCSGIIFALRRIEDFLAELKKKYIGKDTNVTTNTEDGK